MERESTATTMPWSNLKASVVVPLANLRSWCMSVPYPTPKLAWQKAPGSATGGSGKDSVASLR